MMLRSRYIRPGIATNVELGKLGPMAEVVFTRLWMLADREGRLVDDPEKIRVSALANYPGVTTQTVDNVLKSLHDAGLIVRYGCAKLRGSCAKLYISVPKFPEHQRIHPHEPQSVIPPPPVNDRATKTKRRTKSGHASTCNDMPLQVMASHGNLHSNSKLESYSEESLDDDVSARERGVDEFPTDEPPPPSKPNPGRPRRKPPAQSNGSRSEAPPRPKAGAVDMFPHSADDVAVVRASLCEMAGLLHMPNPDDGIVRQVLDAGNGATGAAIHGVLRELWFSKKFRNMHSWGLLPVVVAPWFRKRLAG